MSSASTVVDQEGPSEKKASFRHRGAEWSTRSQAEQWRPFRGMLHDVQTRLPFYVSDWTVAFRAENLPRVLNSSVRMWLVNLIPALAYIIDMRDRTNGTYGVTEGMFASVLAAIVFSVFSCQPMTIVGVTGLINLVNYTNFDIIERYPGVDYLQFQAWVLIWSAITHWIVAILNMCDYTRFFTDTTTECFGLYVGVIYIQKGIELLVLEFSDNTTSAGWLAVVVAMLFALGVYHLERAGRMHFGPWTFRRILNDHAFFIIIILITGFVHFPGTIRDTAVIQLPVDKAFAPTLDRSWLVPFWRLSAGAIFAALPAGCLVTVLFYIDHNVSSIMAQARQFPVKRPAGFHFDFFLLGITTLICGLLGLPAPNGLVPQAPINTESLCVLKRVHVDVEDHDGVVEPDQLASLSREGIDATRRSGQHKSVVTRVVEQRFSFFLLGLMTIGSMTGPLLHAFHWMPQAMFAGVFIVVGWGSVEGNGIVHKLLYLLRDQRMTPEDHPLRAISRAAVTKYFALQFFFFAASVAISQTIAADGFPLVFGMLTVVRSLYGSKIWTAHELRVLDAPTATSASVLVSIGGDAHRVTGEGVALAVDNGIEGDSVEQPKSDRMAKRSPARDDGESAGDSPAEPKHSGKPPALTRRRTATSSAS